MRTLGISAALLLGLVAPRALAGGCFCEIDLYPKVLLGKATSEELAQCEERPKPADALGCMRALSFKNVQSGDQTPESFKLGVEGLIAASKNKSLAKSAVQLLLTSQSYQVPELREKVRPVLVSAGRAPLWDSLVKVADGDAAAMPGALYAYCEQYPVVSQLDLTKVTLAQFWPPPTGVKPADARKRFSCPYGQQLVLDAAIRSLDGTLPTEALSVLSQAQLRILRNAVYARHGRTFQAKDLKEFFSQEPWYRKDPAFTEARLTDQDRRNLELIQGAEARLGKGPVKN